jgi:hypothetical protein
MVFLWRHTITNQSRKDDQFNIMICFATHEDGGVCGKGAPETLCGASLTAVMPHLDGVIIVDIS